LIGEAMDILQENHEQQPQPNNLALFHSSGRRGTSALTLWLEVARSSLARRDQVLATALWNKFERSVVQL
jgi:hypothetical protein